MLLLSPADRSRFKILYLEHTHIEMAIIFNTRKDEIRDTAKKLGIYDENKRVTISRLK
jgi:hypothetical protein